MSKRQPLLFDYVEPEPFDPVGAVAAEAIVNHLTIVPESIAVDEDVTDELLSSEDGNGFSESDSVTTQVVSNAAQVESEPRDLPSDPADFALFGHNLFGDAVVPPSRGKLSDKFIVPPFSVLDARAGYWQDRKRAWISLGIQSELGRGESSGDKLTMSHPEDRVQGRGVYAASTRATGAAPTQGSSAISDTADDGRADGRG